MGRDALRRRARLVELGAQKVQARLLLAPRDLPDGVLHSRIHGDLRAVTDTLGDLPIVSWPRKSEIGP